MSCLHRKALEDEQPFYTTEPEHEQLLSRRELCQQSGGKWQNGSCSKSYSYLAHERQCSTQSKQHVWDGEKCVERTKIPNFYRYCIESSHIEIKRFFSVIQSNLKEQSCYGIFLKLKDTSSLKIEFRSLKNIQPVKSLHNLETLSLKGNNITDISAISSMNNLRYLDLDGNQVSDIAALSSLSKLEHLSIRDNPVYDFSPLENLENLKSIYVDLNIKDNKNVNKYNCPQYPKSKALSDLCMQIVNSTK